jgi:hypothetical protein
MMTDENDDVSEQTIDNQDTPTKPMQPVIQLDAVADEPDEVAQETTAETVMSPPPAPTSSAVSTRRGCGLLFLGAILGAILGTVLTLSILLGLNGSLTFTSTDAQLRRAINDTRIEQEDLINDMATRSAYIDAIATQVGSVAQEQTNVNESVEAVEAEMGTVYEVVTAVATKVTGLDERFETTEDQIEGAATAAAEFDSFLSGLKALLLDATTTTAAPEVEEATPSAKTPTAASTIPAQATTDEPTSTRRATRTPNPTSTPLPLPTGTPEQRP